MNPDEYHRRKYTWSAGDVELVDDEDLEESEATRSRDTEDVDEPEDDEDYDDEEASRAAVDRERLHHYWTKGEGLKRWVASPHPWTTLYRLLRRHVGSARAKRMAAEWVHEVTGNWPGSDKHRVAHGHPPRGDRIGPG